MLLSRVKQKSELFAATTLERESVQYPFHMSLMDSVGKVIVELETLNSLIIIVIDT